MRRYSQSIRFILGWTISLLGILGLITALITGAIYRDLTLKNQQHSLEELIHITSIDLLAKLLKISTDLGMALQQDVGLRKAISENDIASLQQDLENQFHQIFVTANVIKLYQLTVYDGDLVPVTSSINRSIISHPVSCGTLLTEAGKRTGAERIKIVSALCVVDGLIYHSVLVPVGGLHLTGYMEIITAPEQVLKDLEQSLGMPVRINSPDGSIAYQSEKWPDKSAAVDMLKATYYLPASDNRGSLGITIIKDVQELHASLNRTRNLIVTGSGAATIAAVLIALVSLRNTTLKPLLNLKEQIHLVRQNPIHLRKQVDVDGTLETRELAESFNQMTAELHDLYESLEDKAYRDELTNLLNRNYFDSVLNILTLSGSAGKEPFSLLLMDLDRFKSINDTLGHHIGDTLLREVGMRFKEVLRTTNMPVNIKEKYQSGFYEDVVTRIGGDEFAVILPGVESEEQAEIVARKLISSIKESFTIEQHQLSIGVSIGICMYPRDGEDKHTLMRHADIAMYHAKATKRGFAFYTPGLEENNQITLNFEHDLLDAIENDKLELYFQPKLTNVERRAYGAEALLRWLHPKHGFIPPDQFIPIAEKTGLIHQLTKWVITQAICHCMAWQDRHPGIGVSINLSAVNLQDPDLTPIIRRLLKQQHIDPELITLELTETAIMADPEYALNKLEELAGMGLGISIDDFGTGYSSLAYMKKLPVTEIKIDRSFVMDMANDPNDAAIVQSIIALSHSMSLKVVAEGVETEEVYSVLTAMRCDSVQGYFFSKPLPAAEFIAWLDQAQTRWVSIANG